MILLPLNIENIILKYKSNIEYGDVMTELKKEINILKKYLNKRKKINKNLTYFEMKRHIWKNKKLKYKKLNIVKYSYCEYCGMYETSILNNMSIHRGIYFNIERNICTDCIKKIKYANILRYKPYWSKRQINYNLPPLGLGRILTRRPIGPGGLLTGRAITLNS